MIKAAILDVTTIEPRLKHATIFDHFDRLTMGEGFELLNDHDPKPLYYQLLGERGNIFTWEYLENGPQRCRVYIFKPSVKKTKAATVGEIAAQDIRKAEVFKKLGIDFCCGGKKTLEQAAQSVGIQEEQLKVALDKAVPSYTGGAQHNFNDWDLGFLVDYITNVHHKYIREQGPIIEELVDKVSSRHGSEHHELYALADGIHIFMIDLYQHIDHEEQKLFPIVKQLLTGEHPYPDELESLLRYMENEHEHAGEELRMFRTLTQDYQLPEQACNSYAYLFQKIQEFEGDLFQHIHLENNVLFRKVTALQ